MNWTNVEQMTLRYFSLVKVIERNTLIPPHDLWFVMTQTRAAFTWDVIKDKASLKYSAGII